MKKSCDLTWGLILAVTRRIPKGERLVREGRWDGWAPTQLLGINVVLLPHIGSATYETRVKMGILVVENIAAVLAGKEPPNRVPA